MYCPKTIGIFALWLFLHESAKQNKEKQEKEKKTRVLEKPSPLSGSSGSQCHGQGHKVVFRCHLKVLEQEICTPNTNSVCSII